MPLQLSPIEEEYLEAIWRLERKMGVARTTDLANQIKVTEGTVSNMMQHLKEHNLITRIRYKGVNLTIEGKRRAVEVVRRHRLSERFLTDILHLDWSKVHDEACKLEHALSEEVTNFLEKALGHPSTCPHGSPIPTKSGDILEERSEALTNLNPGAEGIVAKITDEESELLQYLDRLGLTPGASVEVEEKAPYNGLITVKVNGVTRTLSRKVASVIHVKKKDCRSSTLNYPGLKPWGFYDEKSTTRFISPLK